MICEKCGKEIPNEALCCPNCESQESEDYAAAQNWQIIGNKKLGILSILMFVCIGIFIIYLIFFLANIEETYKAIEFAFVGKDIAGVDGTGGSFWKGMYVILGHLFPFIILTVLTIALNVISLKFEHPDKD